MVTSIFSFSNNVFKSSKLGLCGKGLTFQIKVHLCFLDEIPVPYSLGCGGFQKMLQDSYLWLSSGGTRSVLHYDMLDNLKCLLDGEKSIVLIDKVS